MMREIGEPIPEPRASVHLRGGCGVSGVAQHRLLRRLDFVGAEYPLALQRGREVRECPAGSPASHIGWGTQKDDSASVKFRYLLRCPLIPDPGCFRVRIVRIREREPWANRPPGV